MTATATATAVTDDPKVLAEEVELRIADIDPDPAQPRLEVDDELASSIKEHGVLKAIEVRPHPEHADRWMIVDGERRWRGSKKAGRTTIAAKITFDVEGISVAARMKRQIVHNQGKPLTPVEEALAFRKIIDDERANGNKSYGPVQLSRDLGIAKSTVTDRLAMTEIPEFWLPLITAGPLQPSHVPELHKWRKVPAKYQERALKQMQADYRWPGAISYSKGKKGERIYIDALRTLLRTFMRKFIKPVSEVPGYKGPTERGSFESYGGPKTYAMDPSLWQPIYRKQLAARKAKRPRNASVYGPPLALTPAQIRANKARARREAQWNAAEPLVAKAVVEALKGLHSASLAGKGAIAELLIEEIVGGSGRGGMEMDVDDLEKTYLARGNTAEDLVRFLALPVLVGDLTYEYGRRETAKRIKAAGLKIDLEKIVDSIQVEDDDEDAGSGDEGDVDG